MIILDNIKCFIKYGRTINKLMDENDLFAHKPSKNSCFFWVFKGIGNYDFRNNKDTVIGDSLYSAVDKYFEAQWDNIYITTKPPSMENNNKEITWTDRHMIVCEVCGNKRCPHASDDSYKCTNSNKPGQLGGIYTEKGIIN